MEENTTTWCLLTFILTLVFMGIIMAYITIDLENKVAHCVKDTGNVEACLGYPDITK